MRGSQQVLGLYDPAQVRVVLGLLPPLLVTGWWGEAPIKVTAAGPRWVIREGCDGESARFRRRASRATLSLTLAPTSLANDLLTATRLVDDKTGLLTFPLSIFDGNAHGRTVAWCTRACIPGPPLEVTFEKKATAYTWLIEMFNYEIVIGSIRRVGNPEELLIGALSDIVS